MPGRAKLKIVWEVSVGFDGVLTTEVGSMHAEPVQEGHGPEKVTLNSGRERSDSPIKCHRCLTSTAISGSWRCLDYRLR